MDITMAILITIQKQTQIINKKLVKSLRKKPRLRLLLKTMQEMLEDRTRDEMREVLEKAASLRASLVQVQDYDHHENNVLKVILDFFKFQCDFRSP